MVEREREQGIWLDACMHMPCVCVIVCLESSTLTHPAHAREVGRSVRRWRSPNASSGCFKGGLTSDIAHLCS